MKQVYEFIVLSIILNLISVPTYGGIIRVPQDYATIQLGITNAVNGDTVLIANGTFSGSGNRDIDYAGKAITVLSEHGPSATVIDCGGSQTEPHRGFLFQTNEGFDSIIDGLTIKNGYLTGESWPENSGAAICCYANSSITIRNCIFTNNHAGWGGAVYCSSDGTISDCEFIGNHAYQGGGGFSSEGSPVVTRCAFRNNTTDNGGGAISVWYEQYPKFYYCDIIENTAGLWGGGIENWCENILLYECEISYNEAATSGGGIWTEPFYYRAMGTIVNCIFKGNSAGEDGGALFWAETNDPNDYDSFIFNTLFVNNSSGVHGGALAFENRCKVIVQNCTFSGNTAVGLGGGLMSTFYSHPIVQSCIFWNNSAGSGTQIALWDYFLNPPPAGNVTIDYCDIQFGRPAIHVDPNCTLYWGSHNIESDPLFTTGQSGPFYLSQVAAGQSADSPCLNTGNDLAASVCLSVDLITHCMNSMTTRTDAGFDADMVDIGSHYFISSAPTPSPTPTVVPSFTSAGIGLLLALLSVLIMLRQGVKQI